tara:strand:- start:38 stop:334 length:297 start_codon:yes stop_codon:yes gene_type:complete
MLRPEPDAGAVVEPKPTPLRLSSGYFQPLLTPDTLYPLVVHAPAIGSEEGCDTTIPIPTILGSQRHDVRGQNRFIIGYLGGISLGTAHLTQHATRPTL